VKFYCNKNYKSVYYQYYEPAYYLYIAKFESRDEATAYGKLVTQMFKRAYKKEPWSYYRT
jgi:hypothetical protein